MYFNQSYNLKFLSIFLINKDSVQKSTSDSELQEDI